MSVIARWRFYVQETSFCTDKYRVKNESETLAVVVGRSRVTSKRWFYPLFLYLLFVSLALCATFFYAELFFGKRSWIYSGDLFATLRDSHMILWGGYGIMYSSHNGLIAPPLGPLSLTPLAEFLSLLHLVEPYPYPTHHPVAWIYSIFYLGLFLAFWAYCAQRFIEHIFPERKAKVSYILGACAVGAYLLFPWGHPEDLAALSFGILAVVEVKEGRRVKASYLAGISLGFQPLTLFLLLPIFIAKTPKFKQLLGSLARTAGVPFFLFLPAVIAAPFQSLKSILNQPNFPAVDHLTLIGLIGSIHSKALSAGPFRLAALVLVVLISFQLRSRLLKREMQWSELVTIATLCLSLRVFFEPVMVPYYLAPSLALIILCTAGIEDYRFLVVGSLVLASVIAFYFSAQKFPPLVYSSILDFSMVAVFLAAVSWQLYGTTAIHSPTPMKLYIVEDEPTAPTSMARRSTLAKIFDSSESRGRFGLSKEATRRLRQSQRDLPR